MLILPIKKKRLGEKKERLIWRNYLMFITQKKMEKNIKLDTAALIKAKQEDYSFLKLKREKN